ncbi:hypothetical protein K435DRAFT_144658 [Dendrothele bispora CBS 962.96]|uniref:Uncharacterized protein n=1 Tax=Dendrothele bispora (strain CBS 962.96) TaxID=1314807 RepID=A0A4S8LQL0_DENBC|nr:hypothetical protein K435DRAFT_223938 [Dendrothele bispora CBS 962.96]THV04820.1 hypothetical protein K435DRAFT_144658 [Dendrothele bispora CBS 962.96]
MACNWLDQIPSESLQTLLTSVRSQKHASSVVPPSLSLSVGINPGEVLEIQGPPASGKTHFVYHLLATCILPVNSGGRNKAAILYDLNASFDVFRFKRILSSRLRLIIGDENLQEAVGHSLKKLHIFYSKSTVDLAVDILHLSYYHTSHLPDSEIGMVAIDSLSTFYWSDRFTSENTRSHRGRTQLTAPLQSVMAALEAFRHTHGASVVLSTWSLFPHYKLPESLLDAPPLQQSSFIAAAIGGTAPLTYLIKLSVPSVPRVAADTSISELNNIEAPVSKELHGLVYSSDVLDPTPFKFSVNEEGIGIS